MWRRCTDEKRSDYRFYGARGIRVCDRWRSFPTFLADMGPRPSPKHTLDRIDSSRGYYPSNCRWATMLEQENNRRNNVHLEHAGERMTISQWARRAGLAANVLRTRLALGWDAATALSKPVRPKNKSRKAAPPEGEAA